LNDLKKEEMKQKSNSSRPGLSTYISNYAQAIAGLGLVAALAAVYLTTLLTGVGYHGDTAKFQYVGHVLGTPHATGYPTYIIINFIFTHLFPFGSLAYKANLLSAILAIWAVYIVYRMQIRIYRQNIATALLSALALGLSYTLWTQSIVAEVYTLHLLFLVQVVYNFLKWRESGKNKHFLIACAWYAFSFGNHLTMSLFLPAVVYFVWQTDKSSFKDIKKILPVMGLILLGALQYGYLFWRYYSPDTPYLEMAVPDLERLFWFIGGAQFKARMFAFTPAELLTTRIPWFITRLLEEFYYLIPIALLGLFNPKAKGTRLFMGLIFLGNMFYAVNYDIPDIGVYLIPNYFVAAIYLGLGMDFIRENWAAGKPRYISKFAYILLLLPLLQYQLNHGRMRHITNDVHARNVETVLTAVKKNAVIVSPDEFYSQYYWYYLIGRKIEARRNIYLVHHYDIHQVTDYIRRDKTIYLPEERKNIPPDLKVYVIAQKHQNDFKSEGFRLKKINAALYEVEQAPLDSKK
jgi:hypothetical protein